MSRIAYLALTMFRSATTQPTGSASSVHSAVTPSSKRFAGKLVAMVTFSPFPEDPRPRRALHALVAEGASVDLICVGSENAPRRQTLNGIDVLRLPLKHHRSGKFEYVYRYAAFIIISSVIFGLRSLTRRYDLVYVHNMPDILVLSSLIPQAFGAKVILDLHDPMPELMMTIFNLNKNSRSVRLLRRMERWSIATADSVLTTNLAMKRRFSSRSCRPEKIGVVMNSPDGQIFPFRTPRLHHTTNQARSKRFVIMYHGLLAERNGLDLAVDALARIRGAVPAAELLIYGSHTAFLERVMDAARNKGLAESVRYLGPKRLEDLVPEIENCDVGVIPNHRNAFTEINTPTRIFEYLALGKPVIAPCTPGIEDYFSKGSLLFFEPGNSAELAQQIEYAFSHPSEVVEIVRRGQQVYLAHAWSRERQILVDLVSELLKEGKPH
jgi:glycosyltransferase involved in cell wall biosynthesis